MEEDKEPTNDELVAIFYNNGHYYGYPYCCINEFILKRLVLNDNSLPVISEKGFIPCETHAKQILDNLICVKDLIKDRKCEWEFPQDSSDGEEEVKEEVEEEEVKEEEVKKEEVKEEEDKENNDDFVII